MADATSALGLDLCHQFAKGPGNICLSPYSIQAAFAMTTNGAAGATLAEMQKVLHLPTEMGTFIAVEEKGTAAAAATAVVMSMRSAARPEEPVVVKADRPFFYAIMDGISDLSCATPLERQLPGNQS
ncbi:MAG: hypothetical protein K9N23_11865 [Akkermansiaceae bacterium]|nr:hypothetical protein [Akkermansiaceae bacterium]MCF8176776.1 hypothetical protein [Burkholderiaceae bacterium]